MSQTLSVSSLNNQIKSLLETTFLHVSVEGEVSRPTYHSSGHLYFTLKDADSSISCVMFKGNTKTLKFQVEEGMAVVVHGSISVFSPRGTYQINCTMMEPAGSGALAKAYEQLKVKLGAKGYFEAENKKQLPRFVNHIALSLRERVQRCKICSAWQQNVGRWSKLHCSIHSFKVKLQSSLLQRILHVRIHLEQT